VPRVLSPYRPLVPRQVGAGLTGLEPGNDARQASRPVDRITGALPPERNRSPQTLQDSLIYANDSAI
jgi:hypothetical protein